MAPTERTRDRVWHEVLHWIKKGDHPTVDEIAETVDSSPTTAREVMKTMQLRGWVQTYRDEGNNKCYRAGPLMIELGEQIERRKRARSA